MCGKFCINHSVKKRWSCDDGKVKHPTQLGNWSTPIGSIRFNS